MPKDKYDERERMARASRQCPHTATGVDGSQRGSSHLKSSATVRDC